MHRVLIDWLALALVLAGLGALAAGFSRRTYRIAAVVTVAAGVAAVTGYGLSLGPRPVNFLHGLQAGGNELARQMLGGLVPGRLRDSLVPGLWGWLGLLVAIGGLLVAFDTLSARRLRPLAVAGDLKVRLPAVEVRAPAWMPGGSARQRPVAVVTTAGALGGGALGGKLTPVLLRVVHALQAPPRRYQVGMSAERCGPDGCPAPEGVYLQPTVGLLDTRTGQSVAAQVLRPCPPGELSEVVAGFTARQLLRRDVTTPGWAAGSREGEDLAASLLARGMGPASRTFGDLLQARQRQYARLVDAVSQSANAGLVQHELASLCDLDGRHLDALALYLGNRLHHPLFLPARYRLAVSLSMLGGAASFNNQWLEGAAGGGAAGNQSPAAGREGIVRDLRLAGMLRAVPRREVVRLKLVSPQDLAGGGRKAARARQERALAELLTVPQPSPAQVQQARILLLLLSRQELMAVRRRSRALALAWCALRHRPQRAAALDLLRSSPVSWWRHPRRRLLATAVALAVADARLCLLAKRPDAAAAELAAARQWARHRLGLDRVLDEGRAWEFGKVPWQALYNAACLYAVPVTGNTPGSGEAADAVAMLRLAISDPACELDRPSEWLTADPGLRGLRGSPEFDELIREQAARDFSPAADNSVAGHWLRPLLPALPIEEAGTELASHLPQPAAAAPTAGTNSADLPAGPAPGPNRPAAGGWLRQLTRPRQPPP